MNIKIVTNGGCLAVVSPYSAEFVARCRQLGGKWDAAAKAWRFPVALQAEVQQALNDCYGWVADTLEERVTLSVTVHRSLSEGQGPVKFGPYELAKAWGRDSGARPGANVALVSGTIGSGGSRKNWSSCVDKGAVFKLVDVPMSVAERLREIAVSETFRATERADAEDRPMVLAEGGRWHEMPADDGMPEGLVRVRNGDNTYHWAKPVEKQVFTVAEV